MQHHQHDAVRRVLADEVDRLIYLLDMIDGDTDLEPQCEDEGASDEREPDVDDEDEHDAEAVCEDEGAEDEREPSLGSLDRIGDQTHWSQGVSLIEDGELDRSDFEDGGDAEAVCEDEGAQCDDEGAIDAEREYSLGSLSEQVCQGNWSGGKGGDVEADYEQLNLQEMLRREAEASRAATARLGSIIGRLSGVPAGPAVTA